MLKRRGSNLIMNGIIAMALTLNICSWLLYAGQKTDATPRRSQIREDNVKPAGKLYALAKKAGKKHAYLTFQSDRGVIAADIKEMMRRSSDVIVGRALKKRGYLNAEGDEMHRIVTIYVQNVFKGGIINGSGIEIKTLGGTWLYSDGTAMSWYPADARPVHDGRSYVLFLNREEEYYVPSFGVQSVMEMDFETESIMPNDLFKLDPVVVKYKNAPLIEFLNEIRAAAKEELTAAPY